MIKKIIVGIVALVGALGLGYILPFVVSDQSVGVKVDESRLQEQFDLEMENIYQQRIKAEVEKEWELVVVNHQDELVAYIDMLNGVAVKDTQFTAGQLENAQEGGYYKLETDANFDEMKEEDIGSNIFDSLSIPMASAEYPVTVQIVKETWVNQMIEVYKDQIDDEDLAFGIEIYNKLDTDILFSLAEEGITNDEFSQAMTYLENNLSDSEMDKVADLYVRYIRLLD